MRALYVALACSFCLSSVSAYYCDGHWVNTESNVDSFMNYSLNGARTVFDYSNPKTSILQYLKEACPPQIERFSCYMQSDNPDRSKKQEEIHFLPFNRKSCRPFSPPSFLERIRNRRVFFVGDSVMGQLWSSLACALFKTEENSFHRQDTNHGHVRCIRSRCPIAPNPNKGFADPQAIEIQSGFINFRRSNVSIGYFRQFGIDKPILQAEMLKQGLSSDDILIWTFGLHYATEQQYRGDMPLMADWINSMASPPHILLLHVPPQHFREANGYYTKPIEVGHIPNCFPLAGWNDNARHKIVPHGDWRNRVLEEIFQPLVKSRKVNIVPISMGLNARFESHMGWGDCTHWCFPSTVFKYLHLMVFNALDKVLPHTQHQMEEAVDTNDTRWKLNPALRNGMLLRFTDQSSVYYVDNSLLREFPSLNAVNAQQGLRVTDSTVHVFDRDEIGPFQVWTDKN